jgi:nucleotide-binding universal stress UspA family protein
MGTIIVGVDGSPGSDAALRWAVAEARLRGARLRLVHVYQPPQLPLAELGFGAAGGMAPPAAVTDDSDQLRRAVTAEAEKVLEAALQRADGDSIGELEVERSVLEGTPAERLIASARDAELLVLGSRGRGGFLGLLLGSVGQQCVHHPPCPVVILPPAAKESANTS